MLMILLSTLAAAYNPGTPANSPYQQCVQTCIAYADQPGFDLRRCVDTCIRQQREYIMTPRNQELERRQFCETYEPECDREF